MKVFQRRLAVGLLAATTLASVLGLAPAAHAAPWTVKCDEDKLVTAINGANTSAGSDTINLKKGCTYEFEWADNPKNALPVITNGAAPVDLVINGNGAKLARDDDDDTQEFRLLEIGPGATVIIKDLTVTGGYLTDPTGGGIQIGLGASLTATNLKVLDNELFSVGDDAQASLGGGISCTSCAVLALNKGTVADNEATSIDTAGSGGSAQGGGIVATGSFGSSGDISLLRTSVKGNQAHSRGAGADAWGGGVSLNTNGGSLTLDRSSVTKNVVDVRGTGAYSASGGVNGNVGAGTVAILDSVISGNTATAEATGSTAGASTEGGGGLYLDAALATITESQIVKNTARALGIGGVVAGGGIYHNGGSLEVDVDNEDADEEGTEISHNKAIANGFGSNASGGGYYLADGTGVFNFTEFEGNEVTAPDGSARGGGLYVDGTVTLNQAEVTDNEADGLLSEGGGIYLTCDGVLNDSFSEVEDNEPDDIFQQAPCA